MRARGLAVAIVVAAALGACTHRQGDMMSAQKTAASPPAQTAQTTQTAQAPSQPDASRPQVALSEANSPGWAMMSDEERRAYHAQMMGTRNLAECRSFMAEHHRQMAQRANRQNQEFRGPRQDACEQMHNPPK